ncbi:MAG: ImmA/IrrE family metallo-endopeptidase [Micrococcales bacterium]|nr:ImmA/IrrE family metallo-endopeptidase [Micrococcales bacterium]OJX69409.1 MAG: serine/arginine repetitive matrix protein 2 [Micrococcales bacterium 72-143]
MARRDFDPIEAAARAEANLQRMSEQLETAVGQMTTGQDWLAAVAFAAQFRSRSFLNTLLIHVQHQQAFEEGRVPEPYPTYVAGFAEWKNLGRPVAKGQAGYMIRSPVTTRMASATPGDPNSWRPLGRREKPGTGEKVRERIINVKPGYVWDVSQTTGDTPVPERPRPVLLEGEAPAGLWDGVAAQIEAAGYRVGSEPDAAALGGANGVTDYTARTVTVRADMDPAARVKTLAHELGHVLMHDPDEGGRSPHRGISEVEAESLALMVCASFGMDTTGYTVAYVAGWAGSVPDRTPLEVVGATGERVRRTALAVLDQLPEAPIGDGRPHLSAESPVRQPSPALPEIISSETVSTSPGLGL